MHETAGTVTVADLARLQNVFVALKSASESDHLLMKIIAYNTDDAKQVAAAIATAKPSRGSNQNLVGVLTWFCFELRPTLQKRFPLYLKELYDTEQVEEAALLEWHQGTTSAFLPEGATVSAETHIKAKASCDAFITWLKEAEDDDDEDDEGDEDE